MSLAWLGIFAAGFLGGSFVIPAKKNRRLHWDQTWLLYCVFGLVVLPVGSALFLAPSLFSAVFPQNLRTVLVVGACGAAWGCGAVLFSISIPRLGFALAYAIVCGTVTLAGSLGPLLIGAAKVAPGERSMLGLGLGLLIAGIVASAWASILRDRSAEMSGKTVTWFGASLGFFVALLAGVLSAMLNIGFAYGGGLIAQANALGMPPVASSLAVWVPTLFGGFIVNLGVSAWKIERKEDWANFRTSPPLDWLRSSSLGVIWFGGILLYSVGSVALGEAGTVYGWAINGGVAILTSAAWGYFTGEWDRAGRAARLFALAGVMFFLAAFGVLASRG